MRINTKTGKLELLKQESDALNKATSVANLLAKHAEGHLQTQAEKAADEITALKIALAEQGKDEEVVNAPY